ncbi:MAG: 50S ribosomal protein L30 [Clostridia bacterium]|nr:50S ribosomal protein L30 [Clostridia bacterium]MDE6210787.1 50S ribosomal protein L30 [Clostridia bacterium]MDE6362495.1 50S ribosomal protein L30 [Clostridia bacterium]MDE6372012.1 50S ribosomal protein L30 [Clostridia bacterium]MDE6472392.1 50S ribosomal protein L30 [Clostridia bacterium]
MEKIKVTLVKSTIGCSQKQKDTIKALGLKKIGSSNVITSNACSEGMLKVVSHLVMIEQA